MAVFNQFLKTLRERKCLDIGKVAESTGVHRNTQTKYEDSRDPPFDYLVDFAELVDVPFIEVIEKRLADSKAKKSAVKSALSSLKLNCSVKESTDHYVANSFLKVELNEVSHKLIPPGHTAVVDTEINNICSNALYCFLNPMTGNYFAALLDITENKLKLCFDSSDRKDLEYLIEGGETEIKIILKALGLVGKVIKAELNF